MSNGQNSSEPIDERETTAVLARVDERTKRTNEILERVIEQRINPLEDQVDKVDNRSRKNSIILSAIITTATISLSWFLNLIPI